jgi:hypothetical protein
MNKSHKITSLKIINIGKCIIYVQILISIGCNNYEMKSDSKSNLIDLRAKIVSDSIDSVNILIEDTVYSEDKNLNVIKFSNGDTIEYAVTNYEWQQAGYNKKPAWCFYKGNQQYSKDYGRLYNWYAVVDSRGIAPKGYHIPNIDELNGLKLNRKLGGFRDAKGFDFSLGLSGFWWSTSEKSTSEAYMCYFDSEFNFKEIDFDQKACGYSIICVKD